MTNAETYRRQIIFQNNFIASMAIIPIYGVTKIAMTDKVQEKLRQVVGISDIEETHLTLDKGKWLVVINKSCKNQVKKSRPYPKRNDSKDHCPRVQQPTRNNQQRTQESNFSILCRSFSKRNRKWTHY